MTGVEPDVRLGRVARERFGLRVIDGFFERGVLAGESFDLAYSCHVWEHLPDPLATSRAAHDLLAERRGHLMIVVPTFRRARTWAWSCFTAPHNYMFTDTSLSNVLQLAGFDIVDHAYVAGADSELWVLARARSNDEPGPIAREDVGDVQCALLVAPLKAALGLPGRGVKHLRTLLRDPRDFASRLWRWCGGRARQLAHASGLHAR